MTLHVLSIISAFAPSVQHQNGAKWSNKHWCQPIFSKRPYAVVKKTLHDLLQPFALDLRLTLRTNSGGSPCSVPVLSIEFNMPFLCPPRHLFNTLSVSCSKSWFTRTALFRFPACLSYFFFCFDITHAGEGSFGHSIRAWQVAVHWANVEIFTNSCVFIICHYLSEFCQERCGRFCVQNYFVIASKVRRLQSRL